MGGCLLGAPTSGREDYVHDAIFLGLSLGVIFGWIGRTMVFNFRLLWHGPIDQDCLSRQGLSNALAQTPESFR
jgi:hypothetical protein